MSLYVFPDMFIPAGALSYDRTKLIGASRNYLFRVESLAKEFQRRYLNKLEKAYRKNTLSFHGRAARYKGEKQFLKLPAALWDKQWIT